MPVTLVPTLPLTSEPALPAATPVTVTGASGSENVSVPVVVSAVDAGVEPVTVPAARSAAVLVEVQRRLVHQRGRRRRPTAGRWSP